MHEGHDKKPRASWKSAQLLRKIDKVLGLVHVLEMHGKIDVVYLIILHTIYVFILHDICFYIELELFAKT